MLDMRLELSIDRPAIGLLTLCDLCDLLLVLEDC